MKTSPESPYFRYSPNSSHPRPPLTLRTNAMQICPRIPEETTRRNVVPDRHPLVSLIERACEGEITFEGSFRSSNRLVSQEMTTFTDLKITSKGFFRFGQRLVRQEMTTFTDLKITRKGFFRFGQRPVPQEITTFPDLFTCIWNFCAKRRMDALIGVLVLLVALNFLQLCWSVAVKRF